MVCAIGSKSALHRRHRHPGRGVGVGDAVDVVAGGMDGAVDHEPRTVDTVIRGVEQNVAIEVDLNQARRRDLLIQHAVWVDEELPILPRNAARNVVGGHFGHAIHLGQPVGGRELHACLPLSRADAVPDSLNDL